MDYGVQGMDHRQTTAIMVWTWSSPDLCHECGGAALETLSLTT